MRAYDEVRYATDDEWRAARALGIGGSDAAAVMGMSPYKTPLSVWMEKTGRAEPEDISGKPAVYWGNRLEDVVADEFRLRHPDMRVRRLNAVMVSRERPFMRASVDRVLTDAAGRRGILEVKTAGLRRAGDWEDGVPDYYAPQPIHYLAVSGFDFYTVAVLIGGQDYREFTYERDEGDIALLVESEEAFWDMVERDVMPAPTSSPADSAALADRWPSPGDEVREMLDEDVPELAAYVAAKRAADAADEAKRAAANALRAAIGDARGVATPTYRAVWSRSEGERLDQKALKERDPAVYGKYLVPFTRDGGIRVTETKR